MDYARAAMMLIREVAERARQLDLQAFAAELGPFGLMQRPDAVRPAPSAAARTMPLSGSSLARPVPVDFQDMKMARLPPLGRDGKLMLIIGRDPECDVCIDDIALSKRHAAIVWDGHTGLVKEMGSSNGTFVNGARIMKATALKSNDDLRFGQSSFIYLLAADLYARLLRVR